jgi:aminoglycoside/choline kinase family phosphotransferase
MDSLPDNHPDSTPGHKIADFTRISRWLRGHDLHAPEIYEDDSDNGYLILEDFGALSFAGALSRGANPEAVYSFAVDVLRHMGAQDLDIDLPDYYASHVHEGRRRIIDWAVPLIRRARNADGLAGDYLAVWDEIESGLPPCPQGFCHIDFHLDNLMWVPGGEGLDIAGILDFQGAMKGPRPYDLVNLLEDARMDVNPALRRRMIERYCADMGAEERKIFMLWYRVLGTQFHCRVAGQFIRLALVLDKPDYLRHLPRLARYLRNALNDPVLAPLKTWFAAEKLDFERITDLNVFEDRAFIRDDAF